MACALVKDSSVAAMNSTAIDVIFFIMNSFCFYFLEKRNVFLPHRAWLFHCSDNGRTLPFVVWHRVSSSRLHPRRRGDRLSGRKMLYQQLSLPQDYQ
jgi:hypothetical protein